MPWPRPLTPTPTSTPTSSTRSARQRSCSPGTTPGSKSATYGPSLVNAQLTLVCIAGRLDPGAGFETLEQIVTYAIERLQADSYPWPQASAQAPRGLEIGDITYLGARVTYKVPVQIGGSL